MKINLFEQIKSRLNLAEYINKFVHLKHIGGRYLGLCPFHSEKTPSFYVDYAKNLYHCFGCNDGGDIFDFYMKYHHVDKKDALKALANLAGVSIPSSSKKKCDLDILNDFFTQQLAQNKKALEFLHLRGVSAESIRKFQLGYAPDYLSIIDFIKANDLELADFGFTNSVLRMFSNRIIFPIYDHVGRLISFGGRIFGSDRILENSETAKYINGPASKYFEKSKILYSMQFHKKSQALYIVEGYLDVILMNQAGYNAVAPMGTSFTIDHLTNIFSQTHEIIIAMDGDNAGRKSALKIAHLMFDILIPEYSIKFIEFPDGEDPASYLLSHNFDQAKFNCLKQMQLYEYIFLYEYLLYSAQIKKTPEAAAIVLKKLMALAQKIKDPALRSEYRKQWRDLWWNKDKKIEALIKIPHADIYLDTSLEHMVLLLFKYILLYPEIFGEVAQKLIKLPLKDKEFKMFEEYSRLLLNNQPLDEEIMKKLEIIRIVPYLNKEEIVREWYKIASYIEEIMANEDKKNMLLENFSEATWQNYKQWIENKEV